MRRSLTQLQNLHLGRCDNVTDTGLEHVASLTQLQTLDMHGCYKITQTGERLLQRSLPNLRFML